MSEVSFTLSGNAVTTLECIPERQGEVLALASVKDGTVRRSYCTRGIGVQSSDATAADAVATAARTRVDAPN